MPWLRSVTRKQYRQLFKLRQIWFVRVLTNRRRKVDGPFDFTEEALLMRMDLHTKPISRRISARSKICVGDSLEPFISKGAACMV
jgi:hypothetical protein